MNPEFRFIFDVYIEKYIAGDAPRGEETVTVLADSIDDAMNKASEYLSCIVVNDPHSFDTFDIIGVMQKGTVFLGIQYDDTTEIELAPETGILNGDLPDGWVKQ